jgi:hypothetical protein
VLQPLGQEAERDGPAHGPHRPNLDAVEQCVEVEELHGQTGDQGEAVSGHRHSRDQHHHVPGVPPRDLDAEQRHRCQPSDRRADGAGCHVRWLLLAEVLLQVRD